MRMNALALRNLKEIVRDPISSILGLLLPVFLLVLFTLLGKSLPVSMFRIENFVHGMTVFGFSFLTMFSALLLAQDKRSSFLMRLFASPLRASDYILGYALPQIPLALVQCAVCYLAAFFLGLPLTPGVFLAFLFLLPQAIFSIFTGLLFGAALNEQQVTAAGNVYIILGSIFGGVWMDLEVIGGFWKTFSYSLPFAHSVKAAQLAITGNVSAAVPHLFWPLGYALAVFLLAVIFFRSRMNTRASS